MRGIAYMIRKEFQQISRDRPMLMIIFVVPVIQLLVLSFAVTTEIKHVGLVIADLDGSAASRDIIRSFAHTDRFAVKGMTRDLREVEEAMRRWEAQVGLVIPPRFGSDLERGSVPHLGLVMDGVDGNAAGVAMGYAAGLLESYGVERVGLFRARRSAAAPGPQVPDGASPARSARIRPPVRLQERMLYNPDLDTKNFMVPAIVVVLLTIIPMMLSGMSLVKEREIGTLEQLQVTPLGRMQLLLGKLVPFLILAYVELAVVTTVAVLVFGIEMSGSYLELALVSLVYLATTIGAGIFVSTVTGTQQQAVFLSWFLMIFMILMSGFFIPIENMPAPLQKITYLDPMRYFIIVVRDIFQKGSDLSFLWRELAALAVFGLAVFSVGVANFRKRIA